MINKKIFYFFFRKFIDQKKFKDSVKYKAFKQYSHLKTFQIELVILSDWSWIFG